jgi:predicted RecA/RadA family phage recombinase
MAQDGFMLSDEGRTITILNDSGTTAIDAGDIVYSAANDDVVGGTAAAVRNAYAAGDIKGKSILCSDTGYQTVIGVALEDIPADGYGSIALEGVFMHPTNENTEAGNPIQGLEGNGTTVVIANKVQVADSFDHKIGQALTGGSAAGKYIIWKLSL